MLSFGGNSDEHDSMKLGSGDADIQIARAIPPPPMKDIFLCCRDHGQYVVT
ncbi:hypothetical protein PVL29_009792 [Vitis rotundifolia]|uniref:Uncharacterized protein n=1 Tax=Vitis rotundifolia TaxID=103349 RepID=A0AA38ZRK0_VITRO|nr:hypothetical protein PVL29_009792 [Vitis rotundifolia]